MPRICLSGVNCVAALQHTRVTDICTVTSSWHRHFTLLTTVLTTVETEGPNCDGNTFLDHILTVRCLYHALRRGGAPLVISHKCRVISWLILAPRPPMHFLHITFPGTNSKISHCAKFHSSSCLISGLPKYDLCETTECSPPLCFRMKFRGNIFFNTISLSWFITKSF